MCCPPVCRRNPRGITSQKTEEEVEAVVKSAHEKGKGLASFTAAAAWAVGHAACHCWLQCCGHSPTATVPVNGCILQLPLCIPACHNDLTAWHQTVSCAPSELHWSCLLPHANGLTGAPVQARL